jgi:hypothetical protein
MLSRAFFWSKLNTVSRQFNWNANSHTIKSTFLSQVKLLSSDAVAATSATNKIDDHELTKTNESNSTNENYGYKANKKRNPNQQMKNSQNRNKKRDNEMSQRNFKSPEENLLSSSSNQSHILKKKYLENRENFLEKKSEKNTRPDSPKSTSDSRESEINMGKIKNVSTNKVVLSSIFQFHLNFSIFF